VQFSSRWPLTLQRTAGEVDLRLEEPRALRAPLEYDVSIFTVALQGSATDGDFINNAIDYNDPARFSSVRTVLDARIKLSAGVIMDLPAGSRQLHHALVFSAAQTITYAAPGNGEDYLSIRYAG